MTRRSRPAAAALLAALAVLGGLALAARGADPSPAGKKIVEVRVVGQEKVSEHEIRGQISTRPGQLYSREAVQQDIRNIYSLGRFVSVVPKLAVTDAGVTVVFEVTERPQVISVDYRGARQLGTADLAKEAGIAEGDFLDAGKLALAAGRMLDLYKSKGYYFAQVTVNRDAAETRRVVFDIREGPRVRVRRIRYQGASAYSAAQLDRQIETRIYRWLFSAGALDEAQLKLDVTRLEQFFRDEGYLDVRVGLAPLSFSDDQKEVTVTFVIDEGPRYRVGSVEFKGNGVFDAHELRGKMVLQPGQYFTAASRGRDIAAIRDQVYGAAGYVDAQVDVEHRYANEPAKVNLVVTVLEGRRITVGRIQIVGNEVTHDKVIRRGLSFFPEEPYSVLAERDSTRRLMQTGLFSSAEITPAAGPGDERDVLVRVTEAKTTSFMVGVGITSDQGLLGNVSLENRNFDLFGWPKSGREFWSGRAFRGAGQTLRIIAEPGTEIMRFQVQFYEPFFRDKPVSLGSNLFVFTRPRESYDETRVGYILSLGRRLPRDWSAEAAFRIEGVSVNSVSSDAPSDVKKDEGGHALAAVKLSLVRDTTDSRFMPTEGNRLTFLVEPATGTDTFVRFGADARAYRTVRTDVFDRKSTVSGKVAAGYIAGRAPVFERFYAGGISTMRGFAFRGVGPHDGPDDDPIGGHFELLASGEYAFPLYGRSQGVFFIDAGTVESSLSLSTFRASVGFEVRIPIDFFGSIPLTFGVGVPVLKDGADETQLLHFLFGTSF